MIIPRATYRVQLSREFTFADLTEILPYLARLGISDVYASPIAKSRQGSTHGYDVVDQRMIDPELGGDEGWRQCVKQLKAHGLRWIQDIVPNHMAYHSENPMLVDVLENGPHSRYFQFFDIDWQHPFEGLKQKVLAPFLGTYYGEALKQGLLQIGFEMNGFFVRYYDTRFPLCLECYDDLLGPILERLSEHLPDTDDEVVRLKGVIQLLKNLNHSAKQEDRYDQISFAKQTLWDLHGSNAEVSAAFDHVLGVINGTPGDAQSFRWLEDVLSQQYFKWSFWKVSKDEINYRRFFTINELLSLRVERQPVFDVAHVLLKELEKSDVLTGVRVDHIDGLYDPKGYLDRLHAMMPDAYVVVEKILEESEVLPDGWQAAGTTGYDFLAAVNQLLVKRDHKRTLTRVYQETIREREEFLPVLFDKKRIIIEERMGGDVDNLARLVKEIASQDRYGSDLTLHGIRRALREILSVFPVYRTYLTSDSISDADREVIRHAMDKAQSLRPGLIHEFTFIRRFLLLEYPDYLADELRRQWIRFATRFQQYTGPLMAKGCEDTAFYVYHRLISLNEVGCNPNTLGWKDDQFHKWMQKRQRTWPHAMNATATHDTKRGEDARARINVIAEMPLQWEGHVKHWMRINRLRKVKVKNGLVPDYRDEYFFYQVLLGLWSEQESAESIQERIKAYLIKAVREAKIHTAWIKPDEAYENAFMHFVDAVFEQSPHNDFLRDFRQFHKEVCPLGIINSLSQLAIKLTVPGVPDIYQGTELWDCSLVDPDNRRPVDYGQRSSWLAEMEACSSPEEALLFLQQLLQHPEDGRLKLFVMYKLLQARKEHADLFTHGGYAGLHVEGPRAKQVFAFCRRIDNGWLLVVVPRFLAHDLKPGTWPIGEAFWQDTVLHMPHDFQQRYGNILTGEPYGPGDRFPISQVLAKMPIGVWVSRG